MTTRVAPSPGQMSSRGEGRAEKCLSRDGYEVSAPGTGRAQTSGAAPGKAARTV